MANDIRFVPLAKSGAPPLLQLFGAIRLEDRRTDRLQHHREQRATLRRGLFDDHVVVGDASATTAPLLGDVDAEETGFAQLSPQFVDLAAGADLVLEIFAAVLTYELPDGTTQLQMMFTGVHDVRMRKWRACHGPSPGLIGQGVSIYDVSTAVLTSLQHVLCHLHKPELLDPSSNGQRQVFDIDK